MNFKIGPFRQAHKTFVQERYMKDGIDSLAMYCAVSLCPVIAAYVYCQEIDPDNPELTRRINSVKIFYGIAEVEE
jgi:hypothetical protein